MINPEKMGWKAMCQYIHVCGFEICDDFFLVLSRRRLITIVVVHNIEMFATLWDFINLHPSIVHVDYYTFAATSGGCSWGKGKTSQRRVHRFIFLQNADTSPSNSFSLDYPFFACFSVRSTRFSCAIARSTRMKRCRAAWRSRIRCCIHRTGSPTTATRPRATACSRPRTPTSGSTPKAKSSTQLKTT